MQIVCVLCVHVHRTVRANEKRVVVVECACTRGHILYGILYHSNTAHELYIVIIATDERTRACKREYHTHTHIQTLGRLVDVFLDQALVVSAT